MSRRRWGGLKSMVVGYLIAQTQGWHVNTETTRPPTSLPADCTRNARRSRAECLPTLASEPGVGCRQQDISPPKRLLLLDHRLGGTGKATTSQSCDAIRLEAHLRGQLDNSDQQAFGSDVGPGPEATRVRSELGVPILRQKLRNNAIILGGISLNAWVPNTLPNIPDSTRQLHDDFKDKGRNKVSKKYVALVCGHWNSIIGQSTFAVDEGEIDLPLVRDIDRPPFMRVATSETEAEQTRLQDLSQQSTGEGKELHPGFVRMVRKGAKQSLTMYRILSHEYLDGRLPVTRVELTPVTGRTHQLRVHCAACGHPIVGDSIYGYQGEGAPNGGLTQIDGAAAQNLQRDIYDYWIRSQDDKRVGSAACLLCLHACRLAIFHPLTRAPMIFDCDPPF
ncbi:hypothetical protein THAOC_34037 [Thalassiosira oceanica]|uniref:Pseudouridine synthase RsuA/RluA-like domain-containing protein n=2 Tax=Thalassiosira oceanica TaxID=159749 RepID=K0RKS8_THAOC|nr:hypothetical protein THAOC_34037 [Thalassiosira oceanica]|eukprot:EJK47257.1 hypothetical protein THAOC_34037 [Thalassiosira oceanica]